MRCTPTIHDLIVLTLPPRHRCPLDRMPASRLLLPRSGLERSDFVPWHKADVPLASANVRCWENKPRQARSEEHTSELQSLRHLVCRLLLEKKKKISKEARPRKSRLQ